MSEQINQTLKKSCLLKFKEADGLGMLPVLLKKKRDKNTILKGIDFVRSFCEILDKDILKKLEDT